MQNSKKEKSDKTVSLDSAIDRRDFIKLGALLTGGIALSGTFAACVRELERTVGVVESEHNGVKIIRAGCPAHNCGGRCVLKLHVKEGEILRIETDDRPGDTLADPQLRACIRGRS
ncbi:MAG: hypothetical protein ACLFUH_00120, partial [Bacteroidales bacterium]